MSTKEFILITVAIFFGVLAALAVAGVFVKQQVTDATSSSPLGKILGL